MPVNFIKLKSFLQKNFHWILLTFSSCFHTGQAECLKKRTFTVGLEDIYRGALEKKISQEGDLKNWFVSFFFLVLVQFIEAFF